MVLEIIMTNLINYVFGNVFLFGLFVILGIVIISMYAGVDKSALILLLAPLILIMGKAGIVPNGLSILIFIAIFITWGIMFKMILGKR